MGPPDLHFYIVGKYEYTWIVDIIWTFWYNIFTFDVYSVKDNFNAVKDELYNKWLYFDVMTQFYEMNPFSWIGDSVEAQLLLINPSYVRAPLDVPADAWWTVFKGIYEVYYAKQIYTFLPYRDYAIFQADLMASAEDANDSWLELFFGFVPQCAKVQEDIGKKFAKIMLWLPAWISFITLVIFRSLILFMSIFQVIFVWIADLFYDIYRFFRNIVVWIITLIINMIKGWFAFMDKIKYWIEVLIYFPIVVVVYIIVWTFQLFFAMTINMFLWILWIFLSLDKLFWDIYWAIHDFIMSILIPIIMFIPNLILSIHQWFMRLIFQPLDNVCVWWYSIWDNIADGILNVLGLPTWEPAYIEWPLALPIILVNNIDRI